MKLSIFKESPARLPRQQLHRLFDLIVRGEGDPRWPASVNLVLIGDARMRRLNRQYRSRDGATDVLSFNIDPPEEPGGVFGEIYLAAPFVRRQATRYERGIGEEYLLLFCHGLLHLFGFDHASPATEAVMFERQGYYLKGLAGARSG